jgi:hypothetical protein
MSVTEDLDPRTQRAATDLLAFGHAAWQDGDWATTQGVADRLVSMVEGTPAQEAAASYRDAVTAIQERRTSPDPIDASEAERHAEAMLTAWMLLRGALLP